MACRSHSASDYFNFQVVSLLSLASLKKTSPPSPIFFNLLAQFLFFLISLFAAFFFSQYFCFSLVFCCFFHTLLCLLLFLYCLFNFLVPPPPLFFRLCVGFPDDQLHISSAVPIKPFLKCCSLCFYILPFYSLSSLNFLSTLLLYFSITSPSHFHHLPLLPPSLFASSYPHFINQWFMLARYVLSCQNIAVFNLVPLTASDNQQINLCSIDPTSLGYLGDSLFW